MTMRRHQRHSNDHHQSVIMVEATTTTAIAHDANMTHANIASHDLEENDVHHPLLATASTLLTTTATSAAVHEPTTTKTSSLSSVSPLLWNVQTRAIAAVLVVGTACSSLMNQHTSNIVPSYFFAISVLIPLLGMILYPCLIYISHHVLHLGWIDKLGITSRKTFLATLIAVTPVAACFALHNLLASFGTSGRSSGQPDVPIVLALILHKLVVPISLLLESIHTRRWPQIQHVAGVALVMMGIVVAAMAHDSSNSTSSTSTGGSGTVHNMKLVALVLCNIPLALGFLLVKQITATTTTTMSQTQIPSAAALHVAPRVSEFELWAVLCLSETFFSICLTFLVERIKNPQLTVVDVAVELWHGIKCIAFATATTTTSPSLLLDDPSATTSAAACAEAAKFTYLGLIPGFAYNLSIPVLVKALGDSTAIPLLRAVALPLAATIAMTGIDPVIVGGGSSSSSSSFSWHAVLGLLFAFTGLLVFTRTTPSR